MIIHDHLLIRLISHILVHISRVWRSPLYRHKLIPSKQHN